MKIKRIFTHIFPVYLVIIVLSIIIISWIFSDVISSLYTDSIKDKLQTNTYSMRPLILGILKNNDKIALESTIKEITSHTDLRITVINTKGLVVAESSRNPELLDNHANRPEVKLALNGQPSFYGRYSNTLKKDTFYFAVPIIFNGQVHAVLRTALPMDHIRRVLKNAYIHITIVGIAVAVIAAFFAYFTATSLSNPLEQLKNNAAKFSDSDGDFTPVKSNIFEINELSASLMLMSSRLKERIYEISEQKNKLNIILANMREGVIAVDSDDNIITINSSAKKILNSNVNVAIPATPGAYPLFLPYNNQNEKKYGYFKSTVQITPIQLFAEKLFKSSEPLSEKIKLPGSISKIIEIHGALLRNHKHKIVGFLLVINDITKLKELQDMRKNFAANVSHELKTPLTAIKGAVETLLDGAKNSPEDSDRFLSIIKKHCDRLTNLINDTMSISKIEQESENDISNDMYSLLEIINVAIDVCRDQALKKNVKLKLLCSEYIMLQVNPQMLEQALVNLIDNALKFSPDNEEVIINAVCDSQSVSISVQDYGLGIPEKHIPHLFERFYRVDKGRSRRDGGTGLGLAIVKHIVQFHNGSVSVESVLGVKTIFTIKLPLVQDRG